jgi:hypothetical protein
MNHTNTSIEDCVMSDDVDVDLPNAAIFWNASEKEFGSLERRLLSSQPELTRNAFEARNRERKKAFWNCELDATGVLECRVFAARPHSSSTLCFSA